MEITRKQAGEWMEVGVRGRLDGYWADHLTRALQDVIRGGHHRIRLNLAEVSYISSIGIRVLVQSYQQLLGIRGRFVVWQPSEPVKRVLEMARLGDLLMPVEAAGAAQTVADLGRVVEHPGLRCQVFAAEPHGSMQCRLVGDPAPLDGCRFSHGQSQTMTFPASALALGLGAFGHTFDECQERFGEFLVAAGTAAYQPTDGSNVPDYLVAEGNYVPELQVLYGLACEGAFAHLARFESTDAGPVRLSDLAAAALHIAGSEAAAILVVAETSGLLGAALRQSPASGPADGAPFRHPEIRRWLSYSGERVFGRAVAVAAGVITTREHNALLRPLGSGGLHGHFHAAAFSYRPLQRGRIDLDRTVRSLFESETLLGVLHLLADDREAGRESEFVRGACWISPLPEITA